MGTVPKEPVWDNEGEVGSWRAGKPKLADQFEAFRGTLGSSVHQCRPRDPEAKGLVERVNGYFETSFLPGRTFTGPGDFNTQLTDWLVRANGRHHRSLGCAPATRWAADKAAMLALPPLAPQVGWSAQVRLPRDHYVRLDTCDYSVDPVAVGRKVTVAAADLEQVSVRMGTKVVAAHQRCWARQQTITNPAHRAAALAMSFAAHRTPPSPVEVVEERDLADYDAVFDLAEVMV